MTCLLIFSSCNNASNKGVKYRNVHSAQVFNDSLLVYTSVDNFVTIENIKSEKIVFKEKLKEDNWSQPILDKYNNLYYAPSDDKFVCVDFKNNKTLWNLNITNQAREFKFVNDSIIISSIRGFGLIAINSKTGKKLYEIIDLNDNNPCLSTTWIYYFAFDENNFYAIDLNCSDVIAYRSKDGKRLWNYRSDLLGASQLVKVDNFIFCEIIKDVGKNEGKICLLDAKSGEVKYEEKHPVNFTSPPVIYKNKVIYSSSDFKLNEFDVEKKTNKVIYDFSKKEKNFSGELFLIDDCVYWSDYEFFINKFNLKTKKLQQLGKCPRGLATVYKLNNKIKFVY